MLARSMIQSARAAARTPVPVVRSSLRSFLTLKNDKKILSDDEQQAGRRKVELDNAKNGVVRIHFIHIYILTKLIVINESGTYFFR